VRKQGLAVTPAGLIGRDRNILNQNAVGFLDQLDEGNETIIDEDKVDDVIANRAILVRLHRLRGSSVHRHPLRVRGMHEVAHGSRVGRGRTAECVARISVAKSGEESPICLLMEIDLVAI
jgi:hypothetical protein